MATITLEYDSKSIEAQEILRDILSRGMFRVKTLFRIKTLFRRKNGLDRALEDVRKGRVYTAENAAELLKEINA
jgi:hypothetical protein